METEKVHDEPSEADAGNNVVHIHGPDDVDLTMTPKAALETGRRISDAAVDVLIENAAAADAAKDAPE